MKTAFDPASRFFTTTETHELIPSVPEVLSEECIEMARLKFYRFIGKMLAKAVYSEILLEPQFSPVFLNLLLGRTNSIDDMSYLDRQVCYEVFKIANIAVCNMICGIVLQVSDEYQANDFKRGRCANARVTFSELSRK